MPRDYHTFAWYDLSPMRPDEYKRQDAGRWVEAVELRNAIEEGKAEAHTDRQVQVQLNANEWPNDADD